MVATILKILASILEMVNRHLQDKVLHREEEVNERFRKAMAEGDYPYASYLLRLRVQLAKNQKGRADGQ